MRDILKKADTDDNLNVTLDTIFKNIESSAIGTASEPDFKGLFDDIDVNKHANNSNYLVWALETIPYEFRLNNSSKVIDIKYRKEISLGGKVISSVQKDDCVTTHHLIDSSSKEELCSLRVEWRAI